MMERLTKCTPNKWLKYDIMDYFGIRDISEVCTTIHRYLINDIEKCLYDVKEDMANNPGGVYVVKLVYVERIYRLPNYFLVNLDDWEKCRADLAIREMQQFSEIWYCRNELTLDLAFGRILFCLDELFPRRGASQVEIVWGASARLIERYPKLDIPFITLTKNGIVNEWDIQGVLYAGRDHDDLMQDVESIITKIPRYYRQIRDVGKWLRDCGCTWMSLEFSRAAYDKIHFIDWDTDNDLYAVKKWRELWMNRMN